VTRVSDLLKVAEDLWPVQGADDWDRPGLICGSLNSPLTKVLLSVDVTADVIADAADAGAEMVISHHPFLLRGAYELTEHSAKGSVLAEAIRRNIALFAAHTNADIVENGVSDVLAKALGLQSTSPLVSTSSASIGHGRIGSLSQPMRLIDFARSVAGSLSATAGGVRVAGDPEQMVSLVALCAGAGDSFIANAIEANADVYVTSDLRHHPAQDALERSKAEGREFALIDISHWAAESLWLNQAAKQLSEAVPDVKFVVSDLRTDPWDFAVTQ
jgi:dinuclear metal center YbgI/SA1388 family protein